MCSRYNNTLNLPLQISVIKKKKMGPVHKALTLLFASNIHIHFNAYLLFPKDPILMHYQKYDPNVQLPISDINSSNITNTIHSRNAYQPKRNYKQQYRVIKNA